MTKARDIADFKFENITDTGTEGTKVASGTTAQRGSTTGQWRYNSTTGFFEGRNANGEFSTLEPIPSIGSVDTSVVDSGAGGNQTIVVTGTNFSSGGTIAFVGSTAEFNATTTTFNSATQVTAVAPKASFLNAQEPYKVRFSSTGGAIGISSTGLINVDTAPTWTTSAGSLGTIFDGQRASTTLTVVASDADGDTISYSVVSGTLPTGASLNSSNGQITGFGAVGSDTTSNFTIRATASVGSVDRAFSCVVKAPVSTTYSYTGSNQTFTVPTGVTAVTAYVWGAGGGGAQSGGWNDASPGGGGGAAVGTINTSSISSLIIIVGQSGKGQDTDASTTIRTAFGGGGGNNGADNKYTGGGGGLSGIFNGSYTHANSLLIAGGGGGGGSMQNVTGSTRMQGGAGGGTNGVDGSSYTATYSGKGGTQSAGGAQGSSSTSASAGSALQGGSNPSSGYGGAGGGGYYGGGAGSYAEPYDMGGGGGGSGYEHPTLVTNGTLYAGSAQTPGNASGSQRGGFGDGGADDGGDGDHGTVTITY